VHNIYHSPEFLLVALSIPRSLLPQDILLALTDIVSPVRSRKLGFHFPGIQDLPGLSVPASFWHESVLLLFYYRLWVGEVFVWKAHMIINQYCPLYIPLVSPSGTYCYNIEVSVLSTLPLSPSLFETIVILSPHQQGILYFSLSLFRCLVDLSFVRKAPVLWC
jgi:hypothetical protein